MGKASDDGSLLWIYFFMFIAICSPVSVGVVAREDVLDLWLCAVRVWSAARPFMIAVLVVLIVWGAWTVSRDVWGSPRLIAVLLTMGFVFIVGDAVFGMDDEIEELLAARAMTEAVETSSAAGTGGECGLEDDR